ncbi:hypothetical protein BDW59DRAFT_167429 [Aspergillus cavernicola]|uniref:Caspase domain-containing protein n=1 Tax=Aspergillus cavernicola TaxID=176166 RepID=A0ABR4HE36_9EURO
MRSSKPKDSFRVTKSPKRLQEFAANLEKSFKASLPSRDHPYDKVAVLAFHWANDEMGVEALETQLLGLFKDIYGYEIEPWIIPLANSTWALVTKLVTWTNDHQGDRTLRIYVYSGHAASAGTTDGVWELAGRADSQGNLVGPKADWFSASRGIESAPGDICYIFDCCSAGPAALESGAELICASGWEQSAGENLQYSFTQALIDTLKDLKGQTETLAGIFAVLFRNVYESQISSCPVHVPKRNSPSITLAKLGKSNEVPQNKRVKTQHRVLLSVHLKDNQPDIEAWNDWVNTNIPPGIVSADIKIESVFKTSSIIMLVTVPLEIWTMLDRDDEAFSFVSHVLSHNTLPTATAQSLQPPLPVRPPPDPQSSENTPPSHRYRKSLG